MAIRKVFLIGALIALVAAADASQTPAGDKVLDALERHDRAEALRWILSIESLSGGPKPASTPAEFVDLIINCRIASRDRRTDYAPQTQVDWNCPDGRYRALLFETPNEPFVVVVEFWDPKRMAAEFDQNGKRRPVIAIPRPPSMVPATPLPPTLPPDQKVVEEFGQAMMKGNSATLSGSLRPGAEVTLYRRNVVHKVSLVEEFGVGPAALARILPIARNKVEGELELSCRVVGQSGRCSLESDVGDYLLFASFAMQGNMIGRIEFYYFNPRTVRLDMAD